MKSKKVISVLGIDEYTRDYKSSIAKLATIDDPLRMMINDKTDIKRNLIYHVRPKLKNEN
jgi:hypothetical protein